MADPIEQFLKSIPLFALIDASDRLEVLRLLRPVDLQPGEVLFNEGEPGHAMWVLGPGVEVSVTATNARGPNMVARVHGGETLGEMALIDDGPRSGTAVVVEGGPAHQIYATDFAAMREGQNPSVFKVLRKLCVELAAKLRRTSDRLVAPSATPYPAPGLSSGRRATEEDVQAFAPFQSLPKVVKLALAQKLTVHDFDGVDPVFSEGDKADSAYFIVSGEVTVGKNGVTLATQGPGTMMGLVAVLDHGKRSASCLTTGPTRMLRLSRSDFDSLFHATNRFAFTLIELVCRQLVTHIRATNAMLAAPKVSDEDFLPEGELLPLELEMQVGL